ncbi:hypothetical protein BaRGS_00035896 [Batillaria attramentaria]|uniref:Uncharacterized protein n=1 Tax=Batillaria attramentaria TaxID=370345 RepID=A0ABD0JD84_9CAEN
MNCRRIYGAEDTTSSNNLSAQVGVATVDRRAGNCERSATSGIQLDTCTALFELLQISMAGTQQTGDFSVLMLPVLLALGVQGLTWNDNFGADLRTCVGKQLQFEWSYTLHNTEMEVNKK